MTKNRLLTREEEIDLGHSVQNGLKAKSKLSEGDYSSDSEKLDLERQVREYDRAREIFVSHNMPLVINRASNFKSRIQTTLEFEDVVNNGAIGLLKAIDKFDPTRGNKFSTVAYMWINQSMQRESNNTQRMVRLPENRVSDHYNMNKIREQLGEGVTQSEIERVTMEKLGLNRDEMLSIRNAAYLPDSLNRRVSDGESEGKELMDTADIAGSAPSSESQVVHAEIRKELRSAFESLKPVESEVVASHFKFDDGTGSPIRKKDVRERHQISSVKYNSILENAMASLKQAFEDRGLNSEDFSTH